MKHFTIFASRNNTDILGETIHHIFAKDYTIKQEGREVLLQSKGWFKKSRLTMRMATEETAPDYFAANIPGMMGFYQQIPFEDSRLQELVLTQISVLNTMIAIEAEQEISDDQLQLILQLLAVAGEIGFISDGSLLDCEGRLIVDGSGKSGPGAAGFSPRACTNKIEGEPVSTEEGSQRRNRSIAYIASYDIPFLEALPELPPASACRFRTQEEIAKRAVALLLVIQYACDVANVREELDESREFIRELLHKYRVADQLTPKEEALLQADPPQVQDAVNISWQYEAYWPLLWALGLVESLELPAEVCDCQFAIEAVSGCESFEQFYEQTSLRAENELLDEADKIYRLHWACVNSRIHGQEAPAGMNESIVMERRRGLFWMIGFGGSDWDEIPMDT